MPETAPQPRNSRARGFAHESSHNESTEWYTPPEVFDALGLHFDLDPCSPGEGRSFVPAEAHYTKDDDGLAQEWTGTVWMNPPYGSQTPAWMRKLADHGDGIALVFARTDPKWAQEALASADAVCFIASRVKFFKGNTSDRGGTPGAGSMLLAYGETARRAVERCDLGVVVSAHIQSEAASCAA
jgi:phage N-6-adenine-methyltransferase